MRRGRSLRGDVGRARGAAAGMRLLLGGRGSVAGAVVFGYHDVQPENDMDYAVTPRRFREHLEWTRRWGYRFVDAAELVESVRAGDDVTARAVVTFDDALAGIHDHALGVLEELAVQATVFVVADSVGGASWWWPGAAPAMDAGQLRELVAAGHRIGSHTSTHASLPSLDDAALRSELGDSRRRLEDLVGTEVTLLAYPRGHHDPRVRAAARAAGYAGAFTFLNGRVEPGLDPFRLPRLTMSQAQHRARLAYQLARPSSSWPDHQVDVAPGP